MGPSGIKQQHLSCHCESYYSPGRRYFEDGQLYLIMEFSQCTHACVLAGAAMLVHALAKALLGIFCAVLSCKEMGCHENKT